ncbi:MAG: type I glyceraldehyde-3-phosphate dehydrogenase [Blautia sp.]
MVVRIAINGFGRIGRLAFRQLFDREQYKIVAVNDPAPVELSAYLLKFDTTQGKYKENSISIDSGNLIVDEQRICYLREMDARKLPWSEYGIDIVVDCSGAYRTKEHAQFHLQAGAKQVVISAPAGDDVPAIVYGVNESELDKSEPIISAASCSTNALAPMVKYLNEYAPIQSGMMLVVHGYTSTQMLQDNAQKKENLRRSRAAAENIIPTTAEAAKAVGRVIPELDGKLSGSAVRVPVPAGCLITFTAIVKGDYITEENINKAMKRAKSKVFGYAEEEYVSSDIVGNEYASVFDPTQTLVIPIHDDEYEVRVAAWFDNENSFTSQMVRLLDYLTSYS